MKRSFGKAWFLTEKLFSERGFTLLEVLVAVTIFGVVLVTAYTFYGEARQVWERKTAAIDLQQNARIAIYEITRELRYAWELKNLSDLPLFDRTDGSQQGKKNISYTSAEGKECRYTFNKGKGSITHKIGIGPSNEIAYDIADLDFFCYAPEGVPGEGGALGIYPMVFVRVKAKGVGRDAAPDAFYLLQTSLRLQNISFF